MPAGGAIPWIFVPSAADHDPADFRALIQNKGAGICILHIWQLHNRQIGRFSRSQAANLRVEAERFHPRPLTI